MQEWTIYFVRHGHTYRNIQNIMNPWEVDSLLNDKWIEQAIDAWIKAKNDNITFDIIISSPLSRALDTAKLIAKETWYKEKIILNSKLVEQYAWVFKDSSHDDIKKEFNVESTEEIRRIFKSIKYNKKEDISDFIKRISEFYKEVTEKYSEKNILIVWHSWVCRVILWLSKGIDLDKAIYKNSSVPNL